MANVEKWSYSTMYIDWGKDPSAIQRISVDSAVMDSDTQCMHCGRNVKKGKLVFCASSFFSSFPCYKGDSGWGEDSYRPTFCSSNHAKLFAKNNNGL